MKNFILLAGALLLLPLWTHAQGFYARVAIGGGLGTNADYRLLFNQTVHEDGTYTLETVPVTMGTGGNISAAAGYLLTKNFGFELALSEMMGIAMKGTYVSELPGGWSETTRYYGRMFMVIPSFVLTPALEKVNPYGRIGLIIGAFPQLYRTYEATRSSGVDYEEKTKEYYHGGLAMGVLLAMGVEFNLSDLIALTLELNYNGISYSPKKSIYKLYEQDYQDRLGDLSTYEKETTYVKELDLTTAPVDPDTPKKELRTNYSFSNVGVNFGVKFKIGKK